MLWGEEAGFTSGDFEQTGELFGGLSLYRATDREVIEDIGHEPNSRRVYTGDQDILKNGDIVVSLGANPCAIVIGRLANGIGVLHSLGNSWTTAHNDLLSKF